MTIRLLPQNLINQIAAGEVVERPASVVKELMENAVDAGADKITVKVINAGKSSILVQDNGCGMDKESLHLCVLSHATSKLKEGDLMDICTMGFRGEALPSIASISRMDIRSSDNGDDGHSISLEGGTEIDFSPASCPKGTTIEVRDLFFATPARLKFLKSDAVEMDYCHTIFNRIALANKNISFEFSDEKRTKLSYQKTDDLRQRVLDVFGEQFNRNIFYIDERNDDMHLYGFVGVPTFNKSTSNTQYFFVNNRFIKDKVFFSALKSAYSTLVPAGRYPVAILYLEIGPQSVDVNVHPTKNEVRFRNEDRVRFFMASALKRSLNAYGGTQVSTQLVDRFIERNATSASVDELADSPATSFRQSFSKECTPRIYSTEKNFKSLFKDDVPVNFTIKPTLSKKEAKTTTVENEKGPCLHHQENVSIQFEQNNDAEFLGTPLYQIHDTYVVSVHGDDLIIIDQHAAAERITLEKLKKNTKLESQNLLLPETCNLTKEQMGAVDRNHDFLISFGIFYEKLGESLIVINALPTIIETTDAAKLMLDIVDELIEFGDAYTLEEKVHSVLATISCHGSLRANHRLSRDEMNSLLRQMESTPNIGQCCHGRPSYVVLSLKDLNKFFERS